MRTEEQKRAYFAWYKRNLTPEQREARRAYNRAYYLKFREERRDKWNEEQKRRASQRTAEQKRARSLSSCAWAKRNPDKTKARNHKRKSRLRGVGGSYTAKEWKALVIRCGGKCVKCGKSEPEIKLTVDHIIPITKGGPNVIENIQPLCLSCNISKRDSIANYLAEVA